MNESNYKVLHRFDSDIKSDNICVGFDISTNVLGVSIFDLNEKKIMSVLSIKFLGDNVVHRMNSAQEFFYWFIQEYDLKDAHFVFEDYNPKFSAGKSTAQTIIALSSMNTFFQFLLYNSLKKDPTRYHVMTVRSALGITKLQKALKKQGEKKTAKDLVFNYITTIYDIDFVSDKSKDYEKYGIKDVCDAIALCETHYIKIFGLSKK